MSEPTAFAAAIEAVPGITKRCPKCTKVKPLDDFSADRSRADGRSTHCRTCRYAANAQWRKGNPEKINALNRAYRAAHPDEARSWTRKYRQSVRNAVFGHYGWSCVCCGSAARPTIDHINGDGREHRAELGNDDSWTLYVWLIRNGFPEGFQTLCSPCNRSKGDSPRCQIDHSDPDQRTCRERRTGNRRQS